jgi:chromate reductase, NAD(P)H dehydrogenase (quinone)
MITILSGSPRKNSNTSRVAKALKLQIEQNKEQKVNIIDFVGFDIPSANAGTVDIDQLTEWQSSLYSSMAESNLVFVLTPEYNWFPSAEIIQMIHVMGGAQFAPMWNHKVFATCGTSNGRGGRMPAIQLGYAINKIISVFNFDSMVSAKMFESQFTDKVLNEEGISIGNQEYMNGLKVFVDYNLNLAKKWQSNNE